MLRVLITAALLAATVSPARTEQPIVGVASVIDGDTIDIHGERIRIEGIDAPESSQTCTDKATGSAIRCGQLAAFFLSDMIGRGTVTCTQSGVDRYHRVLAHCEIAGQDIGAEMVQAGWALAFIRYSREYEPQEATARAAKAGVWATDFVAPWDWRRSKRK